MTNKTPAETACEYYDRACNSYLRLFCHKHGFNFNKAYWEDDRIGTFAYCDGIRYEFDKIRAEVDED